MMLFIKKIHPFSNLSSFLKVSLAGTKFSQNECSNLDPLSCPSLTRSGSCLLGTTHSCVCTQLHMDRHTRIYEKSPTAEKEEIEEMVGG